MPVFACAASHEQLLAAEPLLRLLCNQTVGSHYVDAEHYGRLIALNGQIWPGNLLQFFLNLDTAPRSAW